MKKKLITTTICLTVIIALIIPAFASAALFFPSATDIANAIINHLMSRTVGLASWFAKISGSLLNWVISPDFISFSYTNPSTNPIIKVGLDITKNFVNLGLVVILIFIAISISLQLKDYASKKTLIKLIIIALLVNFAPVICGLIVDAANITMNFFLQGIRSDISGALTDISSESLIGALVRPDTVNPLSLLVRGTVMTGLYFSIGLAFLLMVFVFVFRYIAIWLLVILSPLAFVAWILPATKKVWDMWWKQLVQWSIVGIPMAFFLYLAANAVPVIRGRFESQVRIPGADASVVGIVDQSFPYFVIAAFIYLGFFIGLKATAFGSSSAIRAAQWSRKKAQAYGWKGTKATAKTTAASVAGAVRGAKEGQGLKGRISGAGRGAFTLEGREKGREGVGRILEKMHVVRPGTYEEGRKKRWKIGEEAKKMEKLSTNRLHEIANRKVIRPADRVGAIAAFETLAKRGALKDNEEHLTKKMGSFGADTSQVLKARPDWAPNITKQVASVSTGDFTKNVQATALKNAKVIMSLDASKINHMGLRGTTEQKTAIREAVTQGSTTFNEIYTKISQLYAQNTQQSNQEGDKIMNILTEISSNANLQP